MRAGDNVSRLPPNDASGRDLDHHALDHPGQPGDQPSTRKVDYGLYEVEAMESGPGLRALGQAAATG